MLSGVLFLSVLSVTSLTPSETQSRKTTQICKSRCSCEERENILNINCENKGFTTVSKFQAPPNKISQLFLNGNFLSRLSANEFVNYGNQLSLNNNNLEVIKKDTFSGLESLEYLQADHNYISAIEPGALIKLNKLKVLILSDNLLLSLPPNIFLFVILTHLDLHGNRLKMLPFAGVLHHIGGIMEIQLEKNPWDCTCDLIPLKSWLDTISVFVGDIVCETPFRLHGKNITQLRKQDLCPCRNAGEHVHPPSDCHFQGALSPTYHPGRITPTRAPKASQTRSPVPMLCPSVCVCTSRNPHSSLNINCQERNLHNISELNPKPSYPKKLHLTGNYLQVIYRTDLTEYSSLELLHLGNNRIAVIQEGAFENLTKLRRLYLNGNYIESLSQSLFAGLQSLQYLYLEYNIIKDISPQTFNALHNLQLLFLNNNRLRSLPDNVFGGTMLTIVSLRNNHFSYLPVRGVLDQLSAFIQIDLQENPWDCTCDIMALKNWVELSSTSVVNNEITCNSPSKHAGHLLRLLRNEAICPDSVSPTESKMHTPELHPEVPLSVLIPCLFVVFTCLASFVVLVFVRKHLWINLRRMLYQNLGERSNKELPTAAGPPIKRQVEQTVLYGTPRKYYRAEQPSKNNEHPLLLPGKRKTEPDYLEVLEKQTAMSQL
uniref:SLIT and NTRK like family member 2 n=1 Tax=Sparus aurata TaxID=8175 RepID=A0A671VRC8_SPAAU